MPERDIPALIANCTHRLAGHYPMTVRQRMEAIGASPLSAKAADVYGKGGVVTDLEAHVADILGKESAVFMPSGTMAQPIALRLWADETGHNAIAFHPTCHLELHEHKGYQKLHHLSAHLLGEAHRLFTRADLAAEPDPISTLLIELPQREIGGQLPEWDDLMAVCSAAKTRGMKLHMDGARLWECAPYYKRSYAEIAAPFDSVYVSFYKILNALPGAILAGPKAFIDEARIWQRRQGGNLYLQAPAAISAFLGMERHLPRMGEYVTKAQKIAAILRQFPQVMVTPADPPTNMMHLQFAGDRARSLEASYRIAEEEKVMLFFHLSDANKTELSIGEAALDLSEARLTDLFSQFLTFAAS